jgi:hypothetical protein
MSDLWRLLMAPDDRCTHAKSVPGQTGTAQHIPDYSNGHRAPLQQVRTPNCSDQRLDRLGHTRPTELAAFPFGRVVDVAHRTVIRDAAEAAGEAPV